MPVKPFNTGITVIGAGNVGTHLVKILREKNFLVKQVFSRNLEKANTVAKLANAQAVNKVEDINPDVGLFILAVKDSAIHEISATLRLKGLVVHTSGTASIDLLKAISERTGVFYPLQTFTKARELSWDDIPICLEASQNSDLESLKMLATEFSNTVLELDSEKRKKLHLAAVFVNNFCNYLLSIGADIAKNDFLDFNILYPLAKETLEKAFAISPWNAQTGPALRNDTKTMEEHLNLLADRTHQDVYRLLSEAIAKDFNDQ